MIEENSKYIDIDRYYQCIVDGKEELLKITRHKITDQATGENVFCYRVDCYYMGKELFVGSLSECREWLLFRATMATIHMIRKERSHYVR